MKNFFLEVSWEDTIWFEAAMCATTGGSYTENWLQENNCPCQKLTKDLLKKKEDPLVRYQRLIGIPDLEFLSAYPKTFHLKAPDCKCKDKGNPSRKKLNLKSLNIKGYSPNDEGGKCETEDLKKAMAPHQSNTGEIPFYILSTNRAHHFSYILSRLAFEANPYKLPVTSPWVVINFDQHFDHGSDPSCSKFFCGNWGQFHMQMTLKNRAGAYVSWGNTGGSVGEARCKSTAMSAITSIQNPQLISQLSNMFKDQTAQVYLTVDRDVFKGVVTDYSAGSYNWPDVERRASEILKCFKSTKFVGFDITGLLPADKYDSSQYSRGISDIKFFHGWAKRLLQCK